MTMMKGLLAAAVSLACLTAAGSAHAAVTISFDQVGGDVVATTTGTFDRSMSIMQGISYTSISYISARYLNFQLGQGARTSTFALKGPGVIGTSSKILLASKALGTSIFMTRDFFAISDEYVDNSEIFSTSVFANTTIAAMELNPASYSYAVGGNAVTLNIGQAVAAVPEPATWAMMLVGFGMVGATARYRRRKIATVYA